MSETDAGLSTLGKWIKFIYGLAGLRLLLIVSLASGGYVAVYDAIDPVVLIFLAVSAFARKSRGCAIAMGLIGALAVFSSVFGFSDGDAFLQPFAYENETMWAFLATNILVTLAAANCARLLFQFHRIAGTRIVWRNVVVASLVTLLYMIVLGAFGILASVFLPAGMSDEAKGLAILGPALLAIALAIWRKLPGTKPLPTVIAAGEDADAIQPGTFAGDINLIALSSTLEGSEGEDRIVSPFGAFGHSYRLTGEQYAVFLEWQKTERKKQSWVLALIFPLVILGSLAGPRLSGLTAMILIAALLLFASVTVVYSVRKQRVGFHQKFPDAPEATRQAGSRMDKFLFGIGAGIPGKLWHQILAAALCLSSAGLTVLLVAKGSAEWESILFFTGLSVVFLLSPITAIIGKKRFRERYGLPLTAENLWKVRSGEYPASEFR